MDERNRVARFVDDAEPNGIAADGTARLRCGRPRGVDVREVRLGARGPEQRFERCRMKVGIRDPSVAIHERLFRRFDHYVIVIGGLARERRRIVAL